MEQAAIQARTDNPGAVRVLVDAAMGCSAFAGSADSLRDRVFRAELAYRARKLKPVTEATLATANNFLATVTFAPHALKTTEEQVHLFRLLANIGSPHFVGTTGPMSPAEAVFIAGSLAQQKFFDPNFHLKPDQVAALVARLRQPQRPVQYRAHLTASTTPQNVQNIQAVFRNQIPHEWTVVTFCMHLFLDLAGFPL